MPTPRQVAQRDQWLTACRTFATTVHDLYQAFVAAGFRRGEALELTTFYLQEHFPHGSD